MLLGHGATANEAQEASARHFVFSRLAVGSFKCPFAGGTKTQSGAPNPIPLELHPIHRPSLATASTWRCSCACACMPPSRRVTPHASSHSSSQSSACRVTRATAAPSGANGGRWGGEWVGRRGGSVWVRLRIDGCAVSHNAPASTHPALVQFMWLMQCHEKLCCSNEAVVVRSNARKWIV